MNAKIALLVLALGASTYLVNAQDNPPASDSQRPPPGDNAQSGAVKERGNRGGFHLLPPRAAEQLQLTDDQKKQLAALEAETKAKLEKILTPDQMQKLSTLRPPMRPGGPGGPQMRGGPGGGPRGDNPGGDDNGMPPGPPPDDN